jgi:hypothetical protein
VAWRHRSRLHPPEPGALARNAQEYGALTRVTIRTTTMSDRSVSDLIFRDLGPSATASRSDADREATLREELDKLRRGDSGPRVVPAGRAAEPRKPPR